MKLSKTTLVILLVSVTIWKVFFSATKFDVPPASVLPVSRDHLVLVTGGTKGIGRSLVKDFLRRGYSVVYTGTSLSSCEASIGLEPREFVRCEPLDVEDTEAALALVEKLIERSDLRIIVFNAFQERFGMHEMTNLKTVDRLINGGIRTPSVVSARVLNHWATTDKAGLLVMESSILSYATLSGGELYMSIKGWQTRFFTLLAERFREGKGLRPKSKQIFVSTVEVPIVITKTLNDSIAGTELENTLPMIAWDVDTYGAMQNKRIIDDGISFVVEGPGWKFARFLDWLGVPIAFGDVSSKHLKPEDSTHDVPSYPALSS